MDLNQSENNPKPPFWANPAAIVTLLVVACLAVAPGWGPGRVLVRGEDARSVQSAAWTNLTIECLRKGHLPLWNPHIGSGVPFIGMGTPAVFYPATLVHYLLPPGWSWTISGALQLWLAGIGAWLLAGCYDLRQGARMLAGVVFMLGAANIIGLNQSQTYVTIWMPWAAWGVQSLIDRPTLWRLARLGPIVAVQFLGGDVSVSIVILIVCSLVFAANLLWIKPLDSLRAAPLLIAGLILGAAIAGIQLVPWLEFSRQGVPLQEIEFRAILPWGIGGFWASATSPALIGIIPGLLALWAAMKEYRSDVMWMWLIIAAVLTALAIPMFDRFHSESIAGASLAFAMLAAIGLESLLYQLRVGGWDQLTVVGQVLRYAALALALLGTAGAILLRHHPSQLGPNCARLLLAAVVVCAAGFLIARGVRPSIHGPRAWPWVLLVSVELLAFAIPYQRGMEIKNYLAATETSWTIRVGEVTVPVAPATGTTQRVVTPQSESSTNFEYDPPSRRRGLAITALGAVAWLLVLAMGAFEPEKGKSRRPLIPNDE